DMALLDLRKRLEAQYPGQVDYYEKPVGTLIKQADAEPTSGAKPQTSDGTGSRSAAKEPQGDYDAESASIVSVQRIADNVILYGPPGTGKTYQMQARRQAAYDRGEDYAFVAFHPSYSYEDFIGGLRPVGAKDGSGVEVIFQKGPFLVLCE